MAEPQPRPAWPLVAVIGVLLVGGLMLVFGPGDDEAEPSSEPAPVAHEPVTRSRTVDVGERTGPSPFRTPAATAAEGDEADEEDEDVPEDVPEDEDEDEPHPLAAMVEDGSPITEAARREPKMSEMDPADDRYDPIVDAQQLFAPFEDTLLAAPELTPAVWKAALEQHQDRNLGPMRRAEFLRESGQAEAGGDLMLEWSRLYGHYQARAYGRTPPPIEEP